MTRTLVIPDSHDDPAVSKRRYEVLGNAIVSLRPDNIVQIGDFLSLDSVSFHNHGKPLLQEGRRLSEDIESGLEAYATMMQPLRKDWEYSRSIRKKKYTPKLFWLNGNHEDRVQRFIESQPILEGMVDGDDLVGASQDGWEVIPYRGYCSIGGTSFTHCPLNPATGKPLSGMYVCARAAVTSQHTVVFGHTHKRNVMAVTRNDPISPTGGHRVEGITVGCWLDHWPDYMAHNQRNCDWWEGLTVLHHYDYGMVDPEFISKERAYRRWG